MDRDRFEGAESMRAIPRRVRSSYLAGCLFVNRLASPKPLRRRTANVHKDQHGQSLDCQGRCGHIISFDRGFEGNGDMTSTPIRRPMSSGRPQGLPTPSRKSVAASISHNTPRTRRGGVRISASPKESLFKRLVVQDDFATGRARESHCNSST